MQSRINEKWSNLYLLHIYPRKRFLLIRIFPDRCKQNIVKHPNPNWFFMEDSKHILSWIFPRIVNTKVVFLYIKVPDSKVWYQWEPTALLTTVQISAVPTWGGWQILTNVTISFWIIHQTAAILIINLIDWLYNVYGLLPHWHNI